MTALLAVLGLAALALRPSSGEPGMELRTSAGEGAPAPAMPGTALPEPTTTVEGTGPSRSPTTTRRPASTTTRPVSSTTASACRNSEDPACGELRWDPPPPSNGPMTVSVTFSPSHPRAGEVVTFHVVAEDPDGRIWSDSYDFGDGTALGVRSHPDCSGAYGPWTPPSPTPGRLDKTYQHAYSAAGSFTATFRYRSWGPCPDPAIYGNEGQVVVPLVVSPSSS